MSTVLPVSMSVHSGDTEQSALAYSDVERSVCSHSHALKESYILLVQEETRKSQCNMQDITSNVIRGQISLIPLHTFFNELKNSVASEKLVNESRK